MDDGYKGGDPMHPVFSEQLVKAYMDEIQRQVARSSFRRSKPPGLRRAIGRRMVSAGARLMGAPTPAIELPARAADARVGRAA
jgi:hypothetical protein